MRTNLSKTDRFRIRKGKRRRLFFNWMLILARATQMSALGRQKPSWTWTWALAVERQRQKRILPRRLLSTIQSGRETRCSWRTTRTPRSQLCRGSSQKCSFSFRIQVKWIQMPLTSAREVPGDSMLDRRISTRTSTTTTSRRTL